MEPLSVTCKPAIASRSSFCPQPEIPAIPRISPLFAVKETFCNFKIPSSLRTVNPSTAIRGLGFTGSGRSIFRVTACPTIILVISVTFVSLVAILPMYCPFRSTATRSDKDSTSCILCVIITIAFPSSLIFRNTRNSFSVSCGVSTAVGSSRINISAPRYKTFTISTVCFWETDIS